MAAAPRTARHQVPTTRLSTPSLSGQCLRHPFHRKSNIHQSCSICVKGSRIHRSRLTTILHRSRTAPRTSLRQPPALEKRLALFLPDMSVSGRAIPTSSDPAVSQCEESPFLSPLAMRISLSPLVTMRPRLYRPASTLPARHRLHQADKQRRVCQCHHASTIPVHLHQCLAPKTANQRTDANKLQVHFLWVVLAKPTVLPALYHSGKSTKTL